MKLKFILILVVLVLVLSLIITEKNLSRQNFFTGKPVSQYPVLLFPENAEVVNTVGDVMVKDDNQYRIMYLVENEEFAIYIFSSPFFRYRQIAQENFLEIMNLDRDRACELNVSVSTPSFANPKESGQDYPLSFCANNASTRSNVPHTSQLPSPEIIQLCSEIGGAQIPDKWLGEVRENFLNLADRWCGGVGGNLASQCYNLVVFESLRAKINPAFTLTLWLNSSGASNYACSSGEVYDLGVRDPAIAFDLFGQIQRFMVLPYTTLYQECGFAECSLNSNCREPLHAFLSTLSSEGSTTCDVDSLDGFVYYENIKGSYRKLDSVWQWVVSPLSPHTHCLQPANTFAITWPTDMRCP